MDMDCCILQYSVPKCHFFKIFSNSPSPQKENGFWTQFKCLSSCFNLDMWQFPWVFSINLQILIQSDLFKDAEALLLTVFPWYQYHHCISSQLSSIIEFVLWCKLLFEGEICPCKPNVSSTIYIHCMTITRNEMKSLDIHGRGGKIIAKGKASGKRYMFFSSKS